MSSTALRRLRAASALVRVATTCGLLLSITPIAARGEHVRIRSGNTRPGVGLDTLITVFAGPEDYQFPNAFTPQDFLDARNGPRARITSLNSTWLPFHSADPEARWINDDGRSGWGNSALYAVPFVLIYPFDSATLKLAYLVDDFLGENPSQNSGSDRPGVYLNGSGVAGTNGIGGFLIEYEFDADITALVGQGLNYLYLYDCDAFGGDTGLLFSADISTSLASNSANAGSWGRIKSLFAE